MRNKWLVISAVIVVVLAILLFSWNYIKEKGQGSAGTDQANKNQTSSIPALDAAENIEVENLKNAQQIQESVAAFINSTSFSRAVEGKNFAEFKYSDANGRPVSLDDFTKALNISVPPQLRIYLDPQNYSTIYCLDNGVKNYGIFLNVGRFGTTEKFSYSFVEAAMKSWEKTMLRDLHYLLYPKDDLSEDQLNQNLNFNDGKYRFSEIDLPNGEEGSINYKVLGDPIVIVTSFECLNKVSDYFSSVID